jgi:hypothetical protein
MDSFKDIIKKTLKGPVYFTLLAKMRCSLVFNEMELFSAGQAVRD